MRYEVAESFYERDTSFLSTKNYCTPFIDDQNIPYVPSIVNEESKRNSHTHNIRKKDAYRAQHRTFQEVCFIKCTVYMCLNFHSNAHVCSFGFLFRKDMKMLTQPTSPNECRLLAILLLNAIHVWSRQ